MSFRSMFFTISLVPAVLTCLSAQGVQPYPNAITNREFYQKTPMAPPPINTVFTDPDLGGSMVRATDANTDPLVWAGYAYTPEEVLNAWSVDDSKFYVVEGYNQTILAFAFDPSTMAITSLPGAGQGGGLVIPLRRGPTFSFIDPDLMYGTISKHPLIIANYRFSTGKVANVFDTTTCGTVPAMVAGPKVTSDVVTLASDDSRMEIAAGGAGAGSFPFAIVYDQTLGCRWYNTQTGQIGGQWGPTGQVSIADRFLFSHSKISGNGQYVRIEKGGVWYIWDTTSLNIEPCYIHHGPLCDGYSATGYDTFINEPGVGDEMNLFRRPLGDLSDYTELLQPLPLPHYWGSELNFAWSNGRVNPLLPVCGTGYSPSGSEVVKQPYDGEVFCEETDMLGSTIWRFAHNRAVWNPQFFWTQPLGNISVDGQFFSFTSSWDSQLGFTLEKGDPRTDVWIVQLD